MRFFIYTFFTMSIFFKSTSIASENIPNLVGTWVGINKTVSEDRGYRSWEKKVEILEQDERRFKGKFSYTDGTKNFFGVIHPDNKTITWGHCTTWRTNTFKIIRKTIQKWNKNFRNFF